MSDTPQTDAAKKIWMELAALSAKLERENAALREDKERVDWLLENCPHLVVQGFDTGNRDLWQIDATRKAIDAARKEAQP